MSLVHPSALLQTLVLLEQSFQSEWWSLHGDGITGVAAHLPMLKCRYCNNQLLMFCMYSSYLQQSTLM